MIVTTTSDRCLVLVAKNVDQQTQKTTTDVMVIGNYMQKTINVNNQ